MPRANSAAYHKLRFAILQRDHFTCQYCGAHAPNVQLEVDHVTPVAHGGTDEPENLVTSCFACNRGRGDALQVEHPARKPKPQNGWRAVWYRDGKWWWVRASPGEDGHDPLVWAEEGRGRQEA